MVKIRVMTNKLKIQIFLEKKTREKVFIVNSIAIKQTII